tara:strand:+ start:686 stop:1354 length:669 start_codon:yes stop_codon:yes gene_type:complete
MKAILLGSIGTIADTSHMQLDAFNQAFRMHDLSWAWSPKEYSKMLKVSGGVTRIQQYANSLGEEVNAAQIHLTKTEIFQSTLSSERVSLRQGISAVLNYALNNSIMLGFVTTTTRGNVTEILQATGVDPKIFNVITTNDVVKKPKPDPDAYITALKKLGLLPNQAIAVEDNLDGYNAAIKAELKCVAFPGSMQHGETFSKITQVSSNVAQSVIDAVENRITA